MGTRFRGKVVVVTGAGSGIGKACAVAFAHEGARVAIGDVDAAGGEAAARAIGSTGGTAVSIPTDAGDPAAVEALVAKAERHFGRIDVMINNAAAPLGALVSETTDEQWRHVMGVTLDGVFYGMRSALARMLPQGSGCILNIASAAGIGGELMLGAYGAAKAAVINLTKTAAIENAGRGIRVNAICPGAVATAPMFAWLEGLPGGRDPFERQIPLQRMGLPEEMANVAMFLASEDSAYITGAVIHADGGVTARTGSPRFG